MWCSTQLLLLSSILTELFVAFFCCSNSTYLLFSIFILLMQAILLFKFVCLNLYIGQGEMCKNSNTNTRRFCTQIAPVRVHTCTHRVCYHTHNLLTQLTLLSVLASFELVLTKGVSSLISELYSICFHCQIQFTGDMWRRDDTLHKSQHKCQINIIITIWQRIQLNKCKLNSRGLIWVAIWAANSVANSF